jgi:hypothetical protein
MSVTFSSAEDTYRSIRSQYKFEITQLRKSGAMTDREYAGWSEDGKVDATKFPQIVDLWNKMDAVWKTTERGRAEIQTAAVDSPIVAATVDAGADESSDPLDETILAELPKHVGTSSVIQLAKPLGTNFLSFLLAFRRVRQRLTGVRAYEVLMDDGQLGIETVEANNYE